MKEKEILEKLNINEKELKAIKTALSNINVEYDNDKLVELYNNDTITLNSGRDNREYAWVIYSEQLESCVDVETLEEIDSDKIEELFC